MPSRDVIERFHRQAIRLLRGLRAVDEAAGFSGPRASVLSVLVFRGPHSLGDLARAEGVKPPTMSRLVRAMEAEGLVRVSAAGGDQRRIRIAATALGKRRMLAARDRRIDALERRLRGATAGESAALKHVVELLERTADA
jgi:DNA-binding MarR family transcriptional regulator